MDKDDVEFEVPELAMPQPLGQGMPLLSPIEKRAFDVDAFLCSRTTGQDVHAIVKELRTYRQTLQENLVLIINEKYRDFVSLSTMLQRETDGIIELSNKDGLSEVQMALESMLATMRQTETDIVSLGHEEEANIHERRYLNMLLDIDRTVHDLGHLLGLTTNEESDHMVPLGRMTLDELAGFDVDEQDDFEQTFEAGIKTHPLTLFQSMTYAYQRYTWLQHLLGTVNREKACGNLLRLEPFLKKIYSRLFDHTRLLHEQSFEQPKEQACESLILALRLSCELGESAVEAMLRRISAHDIEPKIESCFAPPEHTHSKLYFPFDANEPIQLETLTHLSWDKPMISNSTSELIRTYNALLDATKETTDIFDATERVGGSMMDAFNHLWWEKVSTAIEQSRGSQLFFIGNADEFYLNYTITQAFLNELESLAPSPRAAKAFRAHSKTVALQRRWAFSAFFQLRARELVTSLEQDLQFSSTRDVPSCETEAQKISTEFSHPGFRSLLRTFAAPWYMTRHFPTLSAREWRLSLHVLCRYRSWIKGQITSLSVSELDIEIPSHTAASTAPNNNGLTNDEVNALRNAVGFLADIRLFEERVRGVFDAYISPKLVRDAKGLKEDADDMLKVIREAMEESLGAYNDTLPGVSAFMLQILRKRCTEPLRHVRAANSQYRAFSRGALETQASTEPSIFIPMIVLPLRQVFVGDLQSPIRRLPMEQTVAWINDVLDHVFSRYTTAIDTITRNLESLRRLKRGTPGLASDEAASDKRVYAQLSADIRSLAAHVEEFTRDAELPLRLESPAWQALRDSTHRT